MTKALMIHLSRKLSKTNGTVLGFNTNLIFMTRGIEPTGVGSELDVNLAEIADSPDKKTLKNRVLTAFGTTLGLLTLSGTAACAQDAPKTQLMADANAATATAPAEKSTAKVEAEVPADDEWDLGFGDDLEAEKAETAAEKAETAAEKAETAAEKAKTAAEKAETAAEKAKTAALEKIAQATREALNN